MAAAAGSFARPSPQNPGRSAHSDTPSAAIAMGQLRKCKWSQRTIGDRMGWRPIRRDDAVARARLCPEGSIHGQGWLESPCQPPALLLERIQGRHL